MKQPTPENNAEDLGNTGSDIYHSPHPPRGPTTVNTGNFARLLQNSYLADKALLVRDLVDNDEEAILFARPRRFGKSTALSMLKTFFEKTDQDTSAYFRNLKIWQCGGKYRSLQGKFPVISMSFKGMETRTWKETLANLKGPLGDEFDRFPELAHSDRCKSRDLAYWQRIIVGTLESHLYGKALKVLIRMLRMHYGQKAGVLIDEYDSMIQESYAVWQEAEDKEHFRAPGAVPPRNPTGKQAQLVWKEPRTTTETPFLSCASCLPMRLRTNVILDLLS